MDETIDHNDALLLRYLDGEMEQDEKLDLEKRLSADDRLRQRLLELRLAIEAVRQFGTIEKVKSIHSEMLNEIGKSPAAKSPVRKMVRYSMAVAASILVLFFAFRFFQSGAGADELYNKAYVEYSVSASRSQQQLNNIPAAYSRREYEKLLSLAPQNTEDSLLTGLALLQMDRMHVAAGWLEQVARTSSPYQQDAEFYLALARIKSGQYGEALKLVKKINNDPAHVYKDQFNAAYIRQLQKLKRASK